jgi:quinol-cytochrome oxidoreductase complex cytochrome b subunit
MANQPSEWDSAKILSKAILHDRATRRKWLGWAALLMLALFAIGLWGIQGWLAQSLLRFTLWWLGCACFTGLVMIFALYDALRAVREEREKFDREHEL